MNQTSAALLEFDSLKLLLRRFVQSPGGRARLAAMEPTSDRRELEALGVEAQEAIDYLKAAQDPQFAGRAASLRLRFDNIPQLDAHLSKLRIEGAALEPAEILELTAVLDRAADVRAVLMAAADRHPRLGAQATRIADFRPLLRELSGKILPDGSVADSASVMLNRVRRDIERQQRNIHQSLERFLRAHRDDGVLQEEFITIRNDRFVVPVVTGHKRKVDGVIHASSGSGQTMFIEPLETIELNNDLVRLREQEAREVYRILAEMTARLREARVEIGETWEVLGELDFLFAKASFAMEFGGIMACFSFRDAPRLHVRSARHPLLEDVLRRQRKHVVPLDLTLEGITRTLLISGPNTGGKTVALKTVGLLALMAQSGLPVPAAEAEFPVFENILADIGDNQSIEQSLSTFSAHVARLGQILSEVTADSLILLDEVGRATDPEEGGALGVAIVDHVRKWGAFALASTHLLAPKIYGASTEGVLNAAMSFNEQTLEPTYHMRTGMPGASAGLRIAERLGLPGTVIEQARGYLSTQQLELARLLRLLETRVDDLTQREGEVRAERDRIEGERKSLKEFWEKRESQKLAELERRTETMLDEFRRRAEETIERLAESGEQKKVAVKGAMRVAQIKRELREEFAATVRTTQRQSDTGTLDEGPPELREGMRVRLKGVREPARIRRLIGADRIEVESGFLKLQMERDDVVEVLPDTPEGAKLPKNVTFRGTEAPLVSFRELNLIGKRADEARDEVEKFLDQAALGGLSRVRIVHGHGMGVLKKLVREMLKESQHVAKYYEAPPTEGGAGATIAEMREG